MIHQVDKVRMLDLEVPSDLEAITYVERIPNLTLDTILETHRLLTWHLGREWSGRFRDERDRRARINRYDASLPEQVLPDMEALIARHHQLDSWTMHNRLVQIHPFVDYNGSVARLVWLHKALREGVYRWEVGKTMLRAYYEQTTDRFNHGKL